MTNRQELADRLEEAAQDLHPYSMGEIESPSLDCALLAYLNEATRLLREPVAGEVLRVVGVAHLYRLEGDEDPRAAPVMIAAPAPNRHHNLFALVGGRRPDESGFILSDGSFADRKQACEIAVQNGQADPAKMPVPGKLFSEDLW